VPARSTIPPWLLSRAIMCIRITWQSAKCNSTTSSASMCAR
jgi:hypothetical protein